MALVGEVPYANNSPIDILYRMRDMAGIEADRLKESIKSAQALFDELDKFADDMEKSAELLHEHLYPSEAK